MRRHVLSNAALATAAAAVALGLAEAVVRGFDIGPRFHVVFRETIEPSDDAVLEYELRPGARDGRDAISSAGLRDGEHARPKPAGVFRIAAIGDSVTYGSGSARELAWPARLAELLAPLADAGARVEVLNLGVPGYNITQVVERLRVRGLPFEPDAIVYGYVLNDPQAFSLEAEALRGLRAAAERGQAPSAGVLTRWLARSRLYLLARTLLSKPPRPAELPADPAYAAAQGAGRDEYFRALHRDAASARRVEQGFADLAALARERGARALVAIFPLFDETGADAALADLHARVAELARGAGLDVLDLLPAYRAAARAFDRELRIDFLHPSPFGQRIAAAAVLDHLCRRQVLPRAAVDCGRRDQGDSLDAEIARAVASSVAAGG